MMNIATNAYSEAQLLRALKSNSRLVYYEYSLSDNHGNVIGKINIEDGKITFDSTQDVMRTFEGSCKISDVIDINSIDYRVTPWMCLRMGNVDVKWALGKFLIEPKTNGQNNFTTVDIVGYDLGKIALDDKVDSRIYMPEDSVYTSMALQIAGTDYDNIEFTDSPKTRNDAREWEIGTSKLKVINGLLSAISYDPLWFDEYGVGHITEYTFPEEQSVERTYRADEQSIIVDGIEKASNKFEIPNKWIRYVENADSEYLISIYVNNDPTSPYSVVNRGRTIVDSNSVKDIATQADLDALVRKDAALSMQTTETLKFTTLNMPAHNYRNCLFIDIPEYNVLGKYVETKWDMQLKKGGMMTHYCEKVIDV